MLQDTRLLGINLHSRRRRRAVVAAYYVLLLALLSVGLYKQRFLGYVFVIQTFTLGGFFGGIRAGGPVKPYSESVPDPDKSPIQELNLNGSRPLGLRALLDEREIHQRDHAHYTAYRLLCVVLCVGTVIFLFGVNLAPKFFANNASNLLWTLTVFVLSLPQSVILWTEPEPLPEGELALASSHP